MLMNNQSIEISNNCFTHNINTCYLVINENDKHVNKSINNTVCSNSHNNTNNNNNNNNSNLIAQTVNNSYYDVNSQGTCSLFKYNNSTNKISNSNSNNNSICISSNTSFKKMPVKVVVNDNQSVFCDSFSTDYNEMLHCNNNLSGIINSYYNNNNNNKEIFEFQHQNEKIKKEQEEKKEEVTTIKNTINYVFNILKSRKKEKKYLRKKFNKIISRVHNTDCLLKKIKA